MRKLTVVCMLVSLVLLVTQPLASAEETVVHRIERTYDLKCSGSGHAEDFEIYFYLFDNQTDWAGQRILEESISTSGESYSISSTSDNRYIIVSPERIDAGDTKTITVIQVVRVDSIDLDITARGVHGDIPQSYQKYTEPVDHLWQSGDDTLKSKVDELTENESNHYLKAKRIFDYVQEHITYVQQSEEHDALWAYNHGYGDCTDYANLFIALCRAAGIPAKFVAGYLYKADPNYLGPHGFAIIYLPNCGWVPVDATEALGGGGGHFAELTAEHLIRLVSDGSNLTDASGMDIPSEWWHTSYQSVSGSCTVSVNESTSTSRVVAVALDIYASNEIVDGTWRFRVKVGNNGSQDISNVNVKLLVDNTYFEAPGEENLGGVNSGTQQYVPFDVHVKKSVENSTISALVTYDTTYGTFTSVTETPATAQISAGPSGLPFNLNLTTILILIVIIGCIGITIVSLCRWGFIGFT